MELFLILEGHDFFNDVQTMVQVFYPNGKYIQVSSVHERCVTVKSVLDKEKCAAFVYEGGLSRCGKELSILNSDKKSIKNHIKTSIYKALSEVTGLIPKWGILTGIRPAKLVNEFMRDGKNAAEVFEILENEYSVSRDKANLAIEVAVNEAEIMKNSSKSACLYVGIPFCPTRCLYCSFTSYPIEKYRDKVDLYLKILVNEINVLPDAKIGAVYLGGGTPTSISAKQLDFLLNAIADKFDVKSAEYTVEAGRPDTVTKEKLEVLCKNGVSRISINPQTMNDETLEFIGRRHSASDVVTAFSLARSYGFTNINMDLIAGLPNETPEMMERTLEQIYGLNPDSITVHTLAVKRASKLNERLVEYKLSKPEVIEAMLAACAEYAKKMKMLPYYMYRQKNMIGNFENVAYCKRGYHSEYNIKIMEETETIYAAGAGAITKIVEKDKIKRIFNVKNVDEYIARNS